MFSVASDMWDLDHEFAWMSEISIRAGVPVTYQVLQADFNPELWREWINRGVAANRRGAWLVPQVAGQADVAHGRVPVGHPSLRPPPRLPGDRAPAARRAGGASCARRRCGRPSSARRPHPAASSSSCGGNLHKLFPLGDPPDYEPPPERSVTALAAAQGRSADEVLYDLMLQRDGKELLYLPLLDYSACNLDAVREMLTAPGHGPRAGRRRRPLRRAVRRQPADLHAGALGARPQPGRAAARRDGGALADPPHGRALRLPRPRVCWRRDTWPT